MRPPSAALLLSVAAALGPAAGCSDALSSLDTIQRGHREVFPCRLQPDFGRRGQTLTILVTLDERLVARLAGEPAFPAELAFGDGVALRSFASLGPGQLEAEVLFSPLAEEGERRPRLVFSPGGQRLEAEGRLWVLPKLD
jgi:hypothetical protein